MKKLTAGDAKAKKKKKKAARDLDCGDRPGSGRSSKQGSPMLGKQLSTRKSSMAVPSHEVVMGGVSEQAHRPGSNGHGEAPDGVRRRPARRKGKKAVAA